MYPTTFALRDDETDAGHIGSGATGQVHAMRHSSGTRFARKLLSILEVTVLQREVEASDTLGSHKNIVEILAHGEFSVEYYYIDMELCDFDLHCFLYTTAAEDVMNSQGSRQKDDKIWHIVEDVSCGVAYIHSQDCIHRDLKPHNILYSAKDDAWKLADFGLTVQRTGGQVTLCGRGTAGYRAPELINNQESTQYSEKVDIWATGCIFYEVLFRTRAFSSDFHTRQGLTNLQFHEEGTSILNGRLKALLIGVIRDSLDLDPLNRPSASTICSNVVPNAGDISCESLSDILQESLSDRLHVAVNFTNARIATVNKIKGTRLVHKLWNVEAGAVICRREQLYLENLPCYADFSVDGLEAWFYDFFTVTVIDAIDGTIRTVISTPPTTLGNSAIRAFAISHVEDRMAIATQQLSRQIVDHVQGRPIDEFKISSAESLNLHYTQDGLCIFTVYTTLHRGRKELTVQCRDLENGKSRRVQITPDVRTYKVTGAISYNGQQLLVLEVTESQGHPFKRWIGISTGCVRYEVHQSWNEEIIYSGGNLLRVDSEGCIRGWPGDVIKAYIVQSRNRILVAVNEYSQDVIFLSESGRWIIEKMTRNRLASR